jgi:HK97 gp10 family phage protein
MPGNVSFIPNPLLGEEWEHSPLALALVRSIGEKVRTEAERLAPTDTGALAASIHVEVESQDGHPGVVIIADVPYAAFVELGTSDTPAQPFLRPAIEEV